MENTRPYKPHNRISNFQCGTNVQYLAIGPNIFVATNISSTSAIESYSFEEPQDSSGKSKSLSLHHLVHWWISANEMKTSFLLMFLTPLNFNLATCSMEAYIISKISWPHQLQIQPCYALIYKELIKNVQIGFLFFFYFMKWEMKIRGNIILL